MDVVTAATASMYGPHTATWDMTDLAHHVVPDGDYTFFIEVTDRVSAPGAFTSFTVTKAPGPHMLAFPDALWFTSISVDYQ